MTKLSAMLLCDFYKISHREQYPDKTETVYSTWTPRISRHEGVTEIVAFGFQGFIKKYLIEFFNQNFFQAPKAGVIADYKRMIRHTLGVEDPPTKHIEELHDLGFMPLVIRALPEGALVPLRVPMLTIQNTHPKFFWLTNYIETLASCEMWQPATSATIANQYRQLFDKFALMTVGDVGFSQFQGHDFAMRGLSSLESSQLSGAGHLLSFIGTDSIPAISYLERYYNASVEREMIGTSIPATEHSVMCASGSNSDADELDAFKRLIITVYPRGFVSIVSDTRDFWNLIANVVTPLKGVIMKRDGRVVIRPDSGDPVKILTGDDEAAEGSMERKGLVEVLWDIFGGTESAQGFKMLDPHIGCIYGEAINIDRAGEILQRLADKKFASTNVVFGIGSFTYQFNTRDTYGFAYKSTHCQIGGEEIQLHKAPKTDDGTKSSQKGVVVVRRNDNNGALECVDGLYLKDQDQPGNELQVVFKNGELMIDQSLAEIRARLARDNKLRDGATFKVTVAP